MLGRESMVVNTGGEKVFVEEVEEVLRRHPDVADALVVGRPSDRFGQEVVAVVSLRPACGHRAGRAAGVRRHRHRPVQGTAGRCVLDEVQRHSNGKADYGWAKEIAVTALDATG